MHQDALLAHKTALEEAQEKVDEAERVLTAASAALAVAYAVATELMTDEERAEAAAACEKVAAAVKEAEEALAALNAIKAAAPGACCSPSLAACLPAISALPALLPAPPLTSSLLDPCRINPGQFQAGAGGWCIDQVHHPGAAGEDCPPPAGPEQGGCTVGRDGLLCGLFVVAAVRSTHWE